MARTDSWHTFFDRTVPNAVLRLAVMVAGWVFVTSSIALTRATGLGTSPISCVPAALSYMTPLTIGTWTFLMNVLFVVIQIILLRRDFNPIQLLQIPCVLVFSAMIDLFVPWCALIPMPNYGVQLAFSVVGCFMTAFGVFLQVKASMLTQPGEGIVLAISKVTRIAFPTCKIAFDTTMVVIAATVSLAVLGGLYGVREGTVLSALAVGAIVGLYNKALPRFERFCPVEGHIMLTATGLEADQGQSAAAHEEERTAGEPPLVIAISREYGSGGREIGHLVGARLGIPVFDTTLIALTAQEAGLTPTYVEAHEEEVRRGVLYNLYLQNYQYIGQNPTEEDELWLAQARAVTRIADAGACVIVGRCAGAILHERPCVFDVFIHAPLVRRLGRVMRRDDVDHMTAAATIERIDAERAEHCRRYTGKPWGAADAYHLSIDSSLAAPDKTAELICTWARRAYPTAPLDPAPKKELTGRE